MRGKRAPLGSAHQSGWGGVGGGGEGPAQTLLCEKQEMHSGEPGSMPSTVRARRAACLQRFNHSKILIAEVRGAGAGALLAVQVRAAEPPQPNHCAPHLRWPGCAASLEQPCQP